LGILRTLRFIANHPLGRKNRSACFVRWLRWQLGSRLLRSPVVLPFVNQSWLVVEAGMVGATGNIYVGLHEFVEMSFVLHLLRKEDLFLDLGANVGTYTILSSAAVGARTLACEPIPATFVRLDRNIRLNNVESLVTACCIAVGGIEGILTFIADQDAMNRVVSTNYYGKVVEVPATTVDKLMSTIDFPAGITVWKADLEGHEEEMLRGAIRTFQMRPPEAILIESNSVNVQSILQAAGYVPVNYDPFTRKLSDADQSSVRFNYFWVLMDARECVTERLATATAFEVQGHCI